MTNNELFEALSTFEQEKGIPMDYMFQSIEKAISVACKNFYGGNENVKIKVDAENKSFDAGLVKTVVEEVFDPNFEVTAEEAKAIDKTKDYAVGDEVIVPIDPKHLGWTSVSSARNVIRQGIRAGEKGRSLIEFQSKLGELVTATVERVDPKSGAAVIKIGKSQATLPKAEQMGCDELKEGDLVKVYIADVKDGDRGPRAIISRTHPGLVRRLFEQEVPEIYNGVVEIKSISREAGSRTKMAVLSSDPNIDAIGSCIGSKGSRVNSIVAELGGEKMDIVQYSDDPEKYVASALSPATVLKVEVTDPDKRSCRATVPDGQLSLAIGNKGQNVRLAARLTGWRIDIRPESGFYGEDEDDEPAKPETKEPEVKEETQPEAEVNETEAEETEVKEETQTEAEVKETETAEAEEEAAE